MIGLADDQVSRNCKDGHTGEIVVLVSEQPTILVQNPELFHQLIGRICHILILRRRDLDG